MSIAQTVVGIVLLATSSVVFTQTTETKPLQRPQPNVSATPAPNPSRSGAKALDQAEILTDTMGVDFGPYGTRIAQILRQNWYNLMPPSVYAPQWKQGKVSIEFSILKDGTVSDMKLASSGDVALDRAALESIKASVFPPLPKEFPGQRLGWRFHYYYNLRGDSLGSSNADGKEQLATANMKRDLPVSSTQLCHFDLTTISISPCVNVRVPAGSTLKFVASGKDITDTSVTWSVSGPGCPKSTCGTISDAGLYTAPVNIPNPPKVIVKATSRADMSVTSKSEVTVLRANPSH
jgi:TonB family protein